MSDSFIVVTVNSYLISVWDIFITGWNVNVLLPSDLQ